MSGGRSVLPNPGPMVEVRSLNAAFKPVDSVHSVHKSEAASLIALGFAAPVDAPGEYNRRDMRAEDKPHGHARKSR